MKPLDINDVQAFVEQRFAGWNQRRIEMLKSLNFDTLLAPNPYFLVAGPSSQAGHVITAGLDAAQAAHEQEMFAELLVDLAVFVASRTCDGRRSVVPDSDLEFSDNGVSYVVSIRTCYTVGNDLWHRVHEQALRHAATNQAIHSKAAIQSVLGICYGKAETSDQRGYLKVVGSDFWYLISGNENLYATIVWPIATRVKTFRGAFEQELARITNRFTHQFIERFCDESGAIDWIKLVEFNSGNYDQFESP